MLLRILSLGSWAALFVLVVPLLAQQAPPTTTDTPPATAPKSVATEPTIVTGSWEPIALEEADRSVETYPVRNGSLLFGTLADSLALDSSVEVQSRDPSGIQGDISIRGGSFEQTLVLLNGIRLNDVQSAHYNLDIPVPLDAIDHVEVLRGSGSTLYGSDAVAGVINIITRPNATDADHLEMRVRSGYGSFGTNEESGFLSFTKSFLSQQFSLERELSDGFRDDREYRNLSLSSESWGRSQLGLTRLFLGLTDRPFGADQFYGNFNSWERTKAWIADISQDLGKNTLVTLGYRRHTDLYELYRDDPGYYTNRHVDDSWDLAVRRQDWFRRVLHINYGAEALTDHVNSNNLGIHSRKQGAIYGAADIRSLRRFSFSVGAREEFYGQGQSIFIPNVSGAYWLTSQIKLRASASRAFRLPSYTDLYYHDPGNIGNPNLKPEKAATYEGGIDWQKGHWKASADVFSRHETDDIDYVRANPDDIWQATNFDKLTFTGWEASLRYAVSNQQSVSLEYSGLHGAEAALGGLQSEYVFNYPSHQAVVAWERVSAHGWMARLRTGVTDQLARNPYVLVDAYGAWTRSRFHPYLRLTNLTNADYQPVYGVVMPGRAVLGGMEICVFCNGK